MSDAKMAADTERNPYPEARSPIAVLDLEARIVLAEQAVIARDERIRRRSRMIVHRVQDGVLRHAGSGIVVAAGTVVLSWLLGRRPRASRATQASRSRACCRSCGR